MLHEFLVALHGRAVRPIGVADDARRVIRVDDLGRGRVEQHGQ